MIILTGGAGFIGSVLLHKLNDEGITDILIVDSLGSTDKWKNLNGKKFNDYIHKNQFFAKIEAGKLPTNTTKIIHLGACSSTTESDSDYLMNNNFRFSQCLASLAAKQNLPLIYASSAATYGDGTDGFADDENDLNKLRPLNGYGFSKHLFDQWILGQKFSSQVVGLKFFNVFGPNEYHKGKMRSLVEKAYLQVLESGKIKLFKSENLQYKDGEQKRDFVYVKDVCKVINWFLNNQHTSGIFNLGTGKANSWLELARAIFSAMNLKDNIEFTDLPNELKGKYQYFTKAPVEKLRRVGCDIQFMDLKDSVADYITKHLTNENKYL